MLVRSARDAELLASSLAKSGIQTQRLDAKLLRGDHGELLFPGRAAALVCLTSAMRGVSPIDKLLAAAGVDVQVIERSAQPSNALSQPTQTRLLRTADSFEAHLIRNRLAEASISAMVTGDTVDRDSHAITGQAGAVHVLVDAADYEQAQAVLQGTVEQADLLAQIEQIAHENQAAEWPVCRHCGTRRQAICPVCGTAGTDFPLADPNFSATLPVPEEDDGELPLAVICTTCDEPWTPGFRRTCRECGHDFGDGLPVPADRTSEPEHPGADGRAVALFLGVMGVIAAALIYFAVLLD